MSLDVLYSKMQARWPLTWKLVEIRPSHAYKCNICALGDFMPLSEFDIKRGDINLSVMDWFETYFAQMRPSGGRNAWISHDMRARYPYTTAYVEIPQTWTLLGVQFNNDDALRIAIGGKLIYIGGYMGGTRDGLENLENFLAEVGKNREDCCAEIRALPQPIAEEIFEHF